jgi:Tol biopolymer transport system component
MRFRAVAFLLVGVSLTVGCGKENQAEKQPEWDNPGIGETHRSDKVAFLATGSNSVLQMNADGSNVEPVTEARNAAKEWPNQQRIINGVCDPSFGDSLNDPIELVSPDGVSLGHLDESWTPAWSPDGNFAALACARADDGTVVVVDDVEMPGDRAGWSRSGSATLSDQMEILLVRADGTEVTQLTRNEAGDWLPRWHPIDPYILIESNRDGNSEIYQLSTGSTEAWRVTSREADDQAPAWSQGGFVLAFASNVNGEFEVVVDNPPGTGESFATGQVGRPVSWPGSE